MSTDDGHTLCVHALRRGQHPLNRYAFGSDEPHLVAGGKPLRRSRSGVDLDGVTIGIGLVDLIDV